jgi:hypothetical protein
MDLMNKLAIGKKIIVKSFCYKGKEGGISMTDWELDERYDKPAEFIIVKIWHDYECGWRGHMLPNTTDKELMDYLRRNAKECEINGYVCYFSEHKIIEIK